MSGLVGFGCTCIYGIFQESINMDRDGKFRYTKFQMNNQV